MNNRLWLKLLSLGPPWANVISFQRETKAYQGSEHLPRLIPLLQKIKLQNYQIFFSIRRNQNTTLKN